VDPASGVRTLLSDFRNPLQGPTSVQPLGIAVVPAVTSPADVAAVIARFDQRDRQRSTNIDADRMPPAGQFSTKP
jgi:hypothetical protein